MNYYGIKADIRLLRLRIKDFLEDETTEAFSPALSSQLEATVLMLTGALVEADRIEEQEEDEN